MLSHRLGRRLRASGENCLYDLLVLLVGVGEVRAKRGDDVEQLVHPHPHFRDELHERGGAGEFSDCQMESRVQAAVVVA